MRRLRWIYESFATYMALRLFFSTQFRRSTIGLSRTSWLSKKASSQSSKMEKFGRKASYLVDFSLQNQKIQTPHRLQMHDTGKLVITSHNICGFDNSKEFLFDQCDKDDISILAIQEHWLRPPFCKNLGTNRL